MAKTVRRLSPHIKSNNSRVQVRDGAIAPKLLKVPPMPTIKPAKKEKSKIVVAEKIHR